MKYHPSRVLALAGTSLSIALAAANAATVTFESVPLGSPNGPNGVWNGQAATGGLGVEGANFNNSYGTYPGGFFWSGFAFSNHTDNTTPGLANQFSAYPGIGAGGSSQYALGYSDAVINIGLTDLTGKGAMITNTTYAALSMLNGDDYGKKFGGGGLGNDPDYFKLTISGFNNGIATGTPVNFFLADFRFANNTQDYIVNQWTYVDFSNLGTVDEIRFGFESSDTSTFPTGTFINTPTYFAIDNITAVPEPGSILLVLLSGACLFKRRR